MNRTALLVLLLFPLLLAAAHAISFTAPANGSSFTAGQQVTFSWDEPAALFSITGQSPVQINSTQTTLTLAAGSYTAVISSLNQSNDTNTTSNASVSITVVNAPPTVSIATDKQSYEVGSSSRISVAVSQPGQYLLAITANGIPVDNYTITVQQTTDFLYALTRTGTYVATLSGGGSSASTSFQSINTSVGVVISGSQSATTARVTTYAAFASGGTPPYSYLWSFSDNTTSGGNSVDHVWSSAGNYTVNVIAQDTNGKQASVSLPIYVTDGAYKLDVTVMGSGNNLIDGAYVTLADDRGGYSGQTDEFGEISFNNLSSGNYTLNATFNVLLPAATYFNTTTISITDDSRLLIRLPIAPPGSPVVNDTNDTNVTDTQTVSAQDNQVEQTVLDQPVNPAAASPSLTDDTVATAQISDLEQKRVTSLNSVTNSQAMFSRSADKQAVLDTIGLTDSFSSAQDKISSASSAEEIDAALSSIPTDVTILSKDTDSQQRTPIDIINDLQSLEKSKGITKQADIDRYEYNAEQALKQVIITSKRTVAKVTFGDGSEKTYTMYSRSAENAPGFTNSTEDMTYLEFIPKSVAQDASELHVDGSQEVISQDPIVRFLQPSYSYYVEGESSSDQPTTLPMPFELVDKPSIIGYVAVKLNLTSLAHGGTYLVIIIVVFIGVLVGNVTLRRNQSSSSLPAFMELAEITLSASSDGSPNYEIAAKYHKDLKEIHATLSAEDRAQTQAILAYVADAANCHVFRQSVEHLRTVIALGDHAAVATSYERIMNNFNNLSEQSQAHEKGTFDSITAELESHIENQEQTGVNT